MADHSLALDYTGVEKELGILSRYRLQLGNCGDLAGCGEDVRSSGDAGFRGRLIAFAVVSGMLLMGAARAQTPKAHFVGSESCKGCHAATYTNWKQTRMANVVRDPKEHPEAVLGDFLHPDPLVTFGLDQVAFVYGSRWKQRYFTKRGDDYYPLPAQWDVRRSDGCRITWRRVRTGGSRFMGRRTLTGRRGLRVMDVTR